MGVLCDCGNTWSPNVIRPQEFHFLDVTKTHICAQKVPVICCFSCEVGSRSNGPTGVLTEADVYHGCQPVVLILGGKTTACCSAGQKQCSFPVLLEPIQLLNLDPGDCFLQGTHRVTKMNILALSFPFNKFKSTWVGYPKSLHDKLGV